MDFWLHNQLLKMMCWVIFLIPAVINGAKYCEEIVSGQPVRNVTTDHMSNLCVHNLQCTVNKSYVDVTWILPTNNSDTIDFIPFGFLQNSSRIELKAIRKHENHAIREAPTTIAVIKLFRRRTANGGFASYAYCNAENPLMNKAESSSLHYIMIGLGCALAVVLGIIVALVIKLRRRKKNAYSKKSSQTLQTVNTEDTYDHLAHGVSQDKETKPKVENTYSHIGSFDPLSADSIPDKGKETPIVQDAVGDYADIDDISSDARLVPQQQVDTPSVTANPPTTNQENQSTKSPDTSIGTNNNQATSVYNTGDSSVNRYIGPAGDVYSSVIDNGLNSSDSIPADVSRNESTDSTDKTSTNEHIESTGETYNNVEIDGHSEPVRIEGPQGDLYTEVAIQR